MRYLWEKPVQPTPFGARAEKEQDFLPAFAELGALLACLLSLDRLLALDLEDGSLELLLTAPLPLEGALAVKAGKADPESEAQRSEAEGRRRDAEAVRSSLESLVRLEKNEAQLLALQDQSATPVVAQLGAVIIK